VYNIDFVNTYPQTANTAALAADFYGANIAAYGCSFVGFQDTLLANKGTQVFSNCYIEGSVDFIWGFSTAYFHQCMVVSNTPGSCIAAQSRPDASTPGGYVFDSCMVTYSSTYGSSFGLSFLGRPYSAFSIAVYMNSYIDKHISADGWQVWSTSNPQTSGVLFGEFNNSGPGSWQASTKRVNFATNLTAAQASKYDLAAWIGDTTWLDMTAYNARPSFDLTGLSPNLPTTNGTTPGSTTTAKVNAHPDSGTVPPNGAVVVSVDGGHNAAYTSLTSALASLPKDSTNQTVFLYPGSYNEQIPSVNRPGAVRIIGYTNGSPGQSYKDNMVTITYSRGLSISPLPAGHSDAETATFATASSRISLYNINMINTDNLDGLESSYVTLAASIYGNDIAFYGCSFDGWQDTLLTGATAGYQYYESCYIGGAIDFIWGYSKAYFKGCTIGAKRKSSCVTAHNRASSSAIGGYIFDQCLFTSAPGATDLTNSVYLGRPYSQYALVVVKNSYLDKTIIPAAWKIWSATDPRTGGITFAEFNNSGPSNWENNAAARQSFGYATLLTSDTYSLSSVMDSTEWIDMTYWNSIMTPQPAIIVPSPTNITVNGTSVYNGTAPPAGALIVSKTPLNGVNVYSTIQAALDAASPSSKVNATIFIYPGVYNEQLIVNKSGHTIFQGYSEATDDFSKNQVTIQFDHGIDTQAPTGSNTDGATVYATGNYFHAFNINFRNNFGTTQNIASLAFAVKSSKYAALFGCQIYGNQDTLSISGSLFTFKTYVEGNVDFIYGSGSAYFLDSTIAPNEDGISITASKRTANTTSAGFVFDQCTLKPAAGTGPFTTVGLGRPWNNLSRVAYVGCYFDSMILPAGWQQWSKSTPNTDGVQYGEYHNYGPGSNICKRATFSQQLSDANVVQYQLGNFFPTTNFIDFSHVDTQPFSVGIGSAQTCEPVSSAISASMVATPSMSSLSSTITSSIPVVTAYTTTTLVEKLTASTLITAPEVTTTTFVKVTELLSISAIDVTKTTIEKATATISITAPDSTLTANSVLTENVGLTITPIAITKTSVLKDTITEGGVTTKAPSTHTVQGTSTVVSVYSSTPKATTVTQSQGSTIVVTSSIYPKAVSTTVLTTISVEPSSTKTTTIKPKNSVTITVTSYKTTTKKSTTTVSCLPTAEAKRMVRRGAIVPRAVASTTTVTLSATVTSFVKTSTVTQPGPTLFVTQTSTATKTTSLKASTTTSTITSVVATRTSTQVGQTYYTTIISTSRFGKTTTLKPSTMTVSSTSFATKTLVSTVTADAVTISSFKTKTSTQTVELEQQTVFITKSADVTSTVQTTMPASTTTLYKTITENGGVVTITVTAAPGTKTVAQQVTTTIIQIATKTAKSAKACIA
jgi:pectin methylesterase-like acyl-CoA thioesterase